MAVVLSIKTHNALIDAVNAVVTNPPFGCGSQLPLDRIDGAKFKADKNGKFNVVFPVEFGTSPIPQPPSVSAQIVSSWDQIRGVIEEYAAENDTPDNPCGPIVWATELSNKTVWRQSIVDELYANLALIANCRCGNSTCGTPIACPVPAGIQHIVKVHPTRFHVKNTYTDPTSGDVFLNGAYEWDATDVLRAMPSGPAGFCDFIFIIIGVGGGNFTEVNGIVAGTVDQNGNLLPNDSGVIFSEGANGVVSPDLSLFSNFKINFTCGGFALVDDAPSIRPYTGS